MVAYFTLINTPKLMVEEGLGLMISFDNLIDLDPNGPLMVKPLSPKLHSATYLIRKKEKVLSRAAQAFHEYLKDCAQAKTSKSRHLGFVLTISADDLEASEV